MCVQVENTDCHQYDDDFRKLVLLVLVLEEAGGREERKAGCLNLVYN